MTVSGSYIRYQDGAVKYICAPETVDGVDGLTCVYSIKNPNSAGYFWTGSWMTYLSDTQYAKFKDLNKVKLKRNGDTCERDVCITNDYGHYGEINCAESINGQEEMLVIVSEGIYGSGYSTCSGC